MWGRGTATPTRPGYDTSFNGFPSWLLEVYCPPHRGGSSGTLDNEPGFPHPRPISAHILLLLLLIEVDGAPADVLFPI